MNIDEIYVNGDSFSATHWDDKIFPDKLKVYSEWLSDFTGIPSINYAVPGSSNDRIIRTTLNYCLQSHAANKKLFVIVGLSYFSREELWYPDLPGEYFPTKVGWDSVEPSYFVTLDTILKYADPPDEIKYSALLTGTWAQLIHTLTKIYMLGATLRDLGFDYHIFSAPGQENTFYPDIGKTKGYLNQLPIWQAIRRDPKIANLVTWSLCNWALPQYRCEDGIHLNTEGHGKFARYLIDNGHVHL